LLPGETLQDASPSALQKLATNALKAAFPDVTERADLKLLLALVSGNSGVQLKQMIEENPALSGSTQPVWLAASSNADLFFKGHISAKTPESDRALSDAQLVWLDSLSRKGDVRSAFNAGFFTHGDSRTPEQAGFLGAMLGSLFTIASCLLIVFPIGVMTAVYLEEFARKSRWVDIIEVNINNLAAVPSIVFGLLGLAVYINVLHLPRSAPIVGGLTLAMMTLPVIIIATRVAIAAIPPAIRDAARGLGASPVQVVWHHVLPLAMPGIMTGTILGMARAIGETAPLIMIGMVAFVANLPSGFFDSATVMPVQVYLWASSPEAGFAEKTASGILLLLVLLLALNALAIYLRKRFETRW
ncbi:MAG: phosphate ABC transporter permease PstA, partial [Proteobacteria bacterium]|nr:phosphate ABC transporter permease PstA [Pseudomonadota bacterium]